MAETSEQKQGTNCKFSLRKNILGILYAMSSCVFFAFSSLFVKLLREIPPQEVVLFRSFIQIIFILPPMVFNQVPLLGEVRYLPYLCVRGLAGTLALCCQFYAFQHLPLADATVIIFSSPIFTGILAFLLLGEAWDGFDAMSTILCFIGVVLIARPTFIFPRPTSHRPSVAVNDWEQVTASLVALCGAVLTSIALIAIRKMKGVHFLVPVFYVALSGVAITAGAILASGTLSSVVCGSHHELLILGVGWCGVAGQALLTKSLQLEKAGVVALVRTLDIVLAFVLQLVFLGYSTNIYSIAGAVLVLCCNALVILKRGYDEKQSTEITKWSYTKDFQRKLYKRLWNADE